MNEFAVIFFPLFFLFSPNQIIIRAAALESSLLFYFILFYFI